MLFGLFRSSNKAPTAAWSPAPKEHPLKTKMRQAVTILAFPFMLYVLFTIHYSDGTNSSTASTSADSDTGAKSEARFTCSYEVQRRSKFPTEAKVDRVSLSDIYTTSNGLLRVTGRAKLMNGLGLMVPHVYTCEVTPNGKTVMSLNVSPG